LRPGLQGNSSGLSGVIDTTTIAVDAQLQGQGLSMQALGANLALQSMY